MKVDGRIPDEAGDHGLVLREPSSSTKLLTRKVTGDVDPVVGRRERLTQLGALPFGRCLLQIGRVAAVPAGHRAALVEGWVQSPVRPVRQGAPRREEQAESRLNFLGVEERLQHFAFALGQVVKVQGEFDCVVVGCRLADPHLTFVVGRLSLEFSFQPVPVGVQRLLEVVVSALLLGRLDEQAHLHADQLVQELANLLDRPRVEVRPPCEVALQQAIHNRDVVLCNRASQEVSGLAIWIRLPNVLRDRVELPLSRRELKVCSVRILAGGTKDQMHSLFDVGRGQLYVLRQGCAGPSRFGQVAVKRLLSLCERRSVLCLHSGQLAESDRNPANGCQ